MTYQKDDFIAACIIPTGIGASIGGYAGDGAPYINLLSKVCPIITNTNSVNAAVFSGINDNILYAEGHAIDLFFKGEIAFRPSKHNRIGIIFDAEIPENVLNVHINTINAVKTVYGLNIIGYEITEENAGVEFFNSESGASTGKLNNSETLVKAGKKLIEKGAEAIAVVCYFNDPEDIDYIEGKGVDPVGGMEAIISHLLTEKLRIPVAHAPAFDESILNIQPKIVNKKVAAEYITPTFLPCILLGLYNAPKIIDINQAQYSDIAINNLKALVMPYDCLSGIPVEKALENKIPLIAVEENKTIFDLTPETVVTEEKIIKAKNYLEVSGYLLSMMYGIYF